MEFKKYISLENHYRQKFIDIFLEHHPELEKETFIISEKIHGANIQFQVEPNGNFQYGKRTSFVTKDEKFYNIHKVVEEYWLLQQTLIEHANRKKCTIRLFGELYGAKVQKGVYYGSEGKQKLIFFDMSINGLMLSQKEFIGFMTDYGFKDLVVPTVKIVASLKEAMEYNTEFDSLLDRKKDNMCEGVVIKPYTKQYASPVGSLFYIKKKNEKFKEIASKPKNQMPKQPLTDTQKKAKDLNNEFKTYITKNRVEGIFSKYGEIEEAHQIGDYIKYVLEDAQIDFLKDLEVDLSLFNKSEIRSIYNVGSMIPILLKEYL